MMVGRLLSFWDGIFSGAMLNFQWVHPNVKLSAFPETTYKLHGTLRIQEVSAVSAKDSKTAWRRYSKHVIIYVFKPWFLPVYKFKTAWWRMVKKSSETSGIYQ